MQNKYIDLELIQYIIRDNKNSENLKPEAISNLLKNNSANLILACLLEKKLKTNEAIIPNTVKNSSHGIRASTLGKHLLLKKINADLEKKDCNIYLLKGMSFNNNLYNDEYPRGCSDIDILVHPRDLQKIRNILNEYATESLQETKKPFSNTYESSWIVHRGPAVYIDLHWNLLPPSEPLIDLDCILENSSPHPFYNSNKIRCLSKHANIIHLLLHMYKDANLLHQSIVDYKMLSSEFSESDWRIVSSICDKTNLNRTIGFLNDSIVNLFDGKYSSYTQKLISTPNNVPTKIKKLLLKFKFRESNIDFITFLSKYVYNSLFK